MTRKTNEPSAPDGRSDFPPDDEQTGETSDTNVQKSTTHGSWEDDALKRIIKQHPQKGIAQVESIEPQEAPPKE
jgi:hypothetical protein